MQVSLVVMVTLAMACRAQLLQEPIPILRLNNIVNADGSFTYEYETGNGIKAEARGQPIAASPEGPAVVHQGSYSFVADDGQTYSLQYTADENGFHPQGSHLPTPPPIPEAIVKALEYIAAHPAPAEDEQRRRFF